MLGKLSFFFVPNPPIVSPCEIKARNRGCQIINNVCSK